MMCGFSALCEDIQEVKERLRVIPVQRAELESSPCFMIDLFSGKRWKIIPTPNGWEILDSQF